MDDYIGKKFKFLVPMETKAYRGDDGRLYIDGMASNTSLDYENDKMHTTAIASMNEQATKGLTGFDGHQYGLDNIFGKIVAVKDKGKKVFHPVFRVVKDKEAQIQKLMDDGIKLGLSIGGMIKDFDWEEDIRVIKDVLLFEVSLTPIPALGDTLGTVGYSDYGTKTAGCSICKQIFKSIDQKYFDKITEDSAATGHKQLAVEEKKNKSLDTEENNMAMDEKDIKALGEVIAKGNESLVENLLKGLKPETKAVDCPKCGASNANSAKFCSQCGADMNKTVDVDKKDKPPVFTKEQLVEAARVEILKEFKEPESEPVDKTKEAYNEMVKGLAEDVLKEVGMHRIHKRKEEGGDPKFGNEENTKKTVTVREAAENLAKQARENSMFVQA